MSGRLESWFGSRGWSPFPFQREVWEAYLAGERISPAA
jgi:ATP-dependent helicase Lhr and Lhr-like helicase